MKKLLRQILAFQYIIFGLVFVTVGLSFFRTVLAQPRALKPGPEEKIRMLHKWKLVEVLGLTEEQASKLFPAMNGLENRRQELHNQRLLLFKDLNKALEDKKVSDKDIKANMVELQENEKQLRQSFDEFRTEVEKILSVRQQARMLLFEERFQQRLKEIAKDIKKGPRQGFPREGGPPGVPK